MRTTRPPPPPPAPPRDTRVGEYTLLDRIAVGGMAEVFRALAPAKVGGARTVVLKRMLPSLQGHTDGVKMFREEGRIGALVHHANVVEHLGVGEHDGQPFLVLELVPGLDLWRLTRWLTREGRLLGPELSVHVGRALLAGLHAVHEARDTNGQFQGVVHRDVSPSNVLLSVHGDVKLGDLGIAHAHVRENPPHVPVGDRAKGKLGYLSPEQVKGLPVDRRADVFGAAVIIAELLIGRPLFAGGSELAVLLAIRDAGIRPLLDAAATLPRGLVAVLTRALAADPAQRTPTAAELAEALRPFEPEPESVLRAELAEIVRTATATVEGTARPQSTPTAPVDHERATPRAASLPDLDAATPLWEDPATSDVQPILYRVRSATGERGPLTFAQLIEQITTADIGPEDQVSMRDGPFRPLRDLPDLSRHLPSSSLEMSTREQNAARKADETTGLRDGGIIRALSMAAVRRDTGLLLCELGGVRKEVYLRDGTPEFVTSNLAGELLGEYLVAKGVISRGELDMSLAVMPRFEGRLGDTLAALGLVEPVHLFRHIAGQVREKLLDLFAWNQGSCALYRGVQPPQSGFPLGLDGWALIEEGVRRRFSAGAEDPRFHRGALVRAVEPPPASVPESALPSDAMSVLVQLPAPRDVRHFAGSPGSRDPLGLQPMVVVLLHLGLVEWVK